MMNESLILFGSGVVGVVLGLIFFGGLWWTVKRGLSSNLAALWFFGSLMLRTSIVLVGFYLIFQGDWRNVVACLFGFLAARIGITFLLRQKGDKPCA